MEQSAKPTRHNRTITVDFQEPSTYQKLITLIRHKAPFYKEERAKWDVGSCLQFKCHLEQVQSALLFGQVP